MMWLDEYRRHFKKGIDKKMVRVIGAFGPKPMPVTTRSTSRPTRTSPSNLVTLATHTKRLESANMAAFGQLLVQTPGANVRSFTKGLRPAAVKRHG